MRIIAFITIVALLGCHNEPPATAPQVTELEGTWAIVSFVEFGEPSDLDGQIMLVEGYRMRRCKRGSTEWQSDDIFSLNPSATPAEITFDTSLAGIYKIDNDILTFCMCYSKGFAHGIRPDRFESTEEYCTVLMVYRRITEEESE